jgi:hypothetical protein
MEIKNLTVENLKELIEESISFNEFIPGYLTMEKAHRDTIEDTFLTVLWYSNMELYEIEDFKARALEFLSKKLNEMPKYINLDSSEIMSTDKSKVRYLWVPIIARWRLKIGI